MNAEFTLSAFGDEISDDLAEQLDTLLDLDIHHLELRGVWGKNVLELTNDEVTAIAEACEARNVSVSAIGSPIGKSPIDVPAQNDVDKLKRAFEIGQALGAYRIRVFSFYPPLGTAYEAWDSYLDVAADRLSLLADVAENAGFTLLLENEKDIVGDTIKRCHGLLEAVSSAHLRFAWDPANFVQVGESAPTADGWPLLGPYVAHVHVKDALASGEVRPAGQGDGQVGLLLDKLRDSGYAGFLALEPHLEVAGHSSGFSGVAGMSRAAGILRRLMREHQILEKTC